MKSIMIVRIYPFMFALLSLWCHVSSFLPSHHSPTSRTVPIIHRRLLLRREQPQRRSFTRFISGKDFIDALVQGKKDESPLQRYTHMIAIPLETNHDFMLDLESVQRAVLYHCPLLIDSCIVPALTRMPLLLIDTRVTTSTIRPRAEPEFTQNDESTHGVLTSRDPTTRALYSTIQQVVREKIQITVDFSDETYEQRERRIRDQGRNGVNASNIKPIVISFKGLEIDGEDNSVLLAIGKEDDETHRLRGLVMELAARIRDTYGWQVSFPPDLHLEKLLGHESDADAPRWRPRVPFMRLPPNFKENLPNPKGLDGEWEFYTPEEKASYIRFPEEGGNGISPIFWYQWWEDSFCNGNGIRMKDLAVYGRTGPFEISETAFYIPHLKVALPDGNQQLQDDEIKAQDYETIRQDKLKNEVEDKGYLRDEADVALSQIKTEANRRIIETIFASSTEESNADALERGETYFSMEKDYKMDTRKQTFSSRSTVNSTNISNIVKNFSNPIESVDRSAREQVKLKKPKPEDNPIFQGWKERKTMAYDTPTLQSEKSMPPFPSDEYFVGLWKLVSSPIALSADDEESQSITNTDPSSSETLILRVDGTTAGGPILDPVGKQKSAGGTWRVFQAEWSGTEADTTNIKNYTQQTRLRIRLVVPPKKEKILVLEGEIRRGQYSSFAKQNIRELERLSTFSIPQTEATRNSDDDDDADTSLIIHCIGEMWIETASPKMRQRKKLGNFSLMKLPDPKPSQIRYTIPSNKPRYYE